MLLRSGFSYNEKPKYKVKINFDEASKEWRKNKRYLGEGVYEYL
jgi:hypothetical protein